MRHVALVPFTGLRVCSAPLRELGLTLPGLRDRGHALAELPALGLLTLAGMLPEGWTCSYHPSGHLSDEELAEQILANRPKIVALSALTASVDRAYALSARLRAAGTKVVIGGLHATACPDEGQQHCDVVAIGQGELTWRRILSDSAASSLARRYSSNERLPRTVWPIPRFDLLGHSVPRFTLQTQRGCPLACDFCAASRLLGPFQEKPLDHIRFELDAIRQLDPRPVIELADDNTFAGTRDGLELCEVLAASGARWFTESDWRIGERPELLARLARSGCVQILIGLESLTFRYPGMGAKQDSLSRMMDAVAAIQDSGVAVNGCFIIGADGETQSSIDRLVQFVLESPLADVQLTLQTPFPGTHLRARLERQGRLLPNRGWSNYTLLDVTYQPDCMTASELEHSFLGAIRDVYSTTATARRNEIRRRIWQGNPSLRSVRN